MPQAGRKRKTALCRYSDRRVEKCTDGFFNTVTSLENQDKVLGTVSRGTVVISTLESYFPRASLVKDIEQQWSAPAYRPFPSPSRHRRVAKNRLGENHPS